MNPFLEIEKTRSMSPRPFLVIDSTYLACIMCGVEKGG